MSEKDFQQHKTFVVLNPVAGHSDPEGIRQILNRYFGQEGRPYQLYKTTGREKLSEVVQSALDEGFELVIAAGGDGTVSGVAEGLIHTDIPLGIIPVGTGNALARELEIPLDVEAALQLCLDEHVLKSIDAIQVTSHPMNHSKHTSTKKQQYFFLNITVGLSALAMEATTATDKRRFGRLAYIWSGLKGLFGLQPQRFTLTVDEESHYFKASELAVVNAGILGGSPLRWGPHIQLDDECLDVAIVRLQTAFDYLKLARDVLLNRHKQAPNVHYLQARQSIEIQADHPLLVQGDGEVIGQTPLQVQVLPGAIRMIIPSTSP